VRCWNLPLSQNICALYSTEHSKRHLRISYETGWQHEYATLSFTESDIWVSPELRTVFLFHISHHSFASNPQLPTKSLPRARRSSEALLIRVIKQLTPIFLETEWIRIVAKEKTPTLCETLLELLDTFPCYRLQSEEEAEAAIGEIEGRISAVASIKDMDPPSKQGWYLIYRYDSNLVHLLFYLSHILWRYNPFALTTSSKTFLDKKVKVEFDAHLTMCYFSMSTRMTRQTRDYLVCASNPLLVNFSHFYWLLC